jgi:hypothetical protein
MKPKKKLPPGVIDVKGGVMNIRAATKEDTWRMIRNLVERVTELEKNQAAHIDTVGKQLQSLESDVRYACSQIKAIIDRMPKKGHEFQATSDEPAVDVLWRLIDGLTEYTTKRYGRRHL